MNKLKKLFLFIIVICSIGTIGFIGYKLIYNIKLNYTFEINKDRDYLYGGKKLNILGSSEGNYNYIDAIEQKSIDLKEVSKLLPLAAAPIGTPEYLSKITSPVDIEYYENIDDKTPVYVIKKGETIIYEVSAKSMYEVEFRGNDSIPTSKRGWRLAKPFKVGGESKDFLWYVKLEDLNSVCYEFFEKNPHYTLSAPNTLMKSGLMPTKRNISKLELTFVDRALYSRGVFLSYDLYLPIFDNVTIILLLLSTIFIGLFISTKKLIK